MVENRGGDAHRVDDEWRVLKFLWVHLGESVGAEGEPIKAAKQLVHNVWVKNRSPHFM